MPTVTLNRKEFERLVGKKLPDEKLKDRISMLGTDLEELSKDAITVEMFPNRPDLLSEQGFARAFSSFIGVKTGLQKYTAQKSGKKVIIDKSLDKVRPYTSCAIIKNITFNDEKIREIIQIQEKMHVTYGRNRKKVAIGIYPLEKISFPITFKAEKPKEIVFQPLESSREMDALQMLGQHPAGREYGHLLEGKQTFPVFRDAKNNVLSVPPIINSHAVGKITDDTTEVFIECSGFDYPVLEKCLHIIVAALADMGGSIHSVELEYPDKKIHSPSLLPRKMKLQPDYINKKLGLSLTKKEIISLLAKMGFGYDNKTNQVLIPCYRADILHQVDLAEDIAIAYGYENFIPEIPKVATIGYEAPIEVFKRQISEVLIGVSLQEVYTYSITNEHALNTTGMNTDAVYLANSLSEEFNVMRTSIVPSLLDVLKQNRNHEYPQRIFDMGTVFTKKKNSSNETGIDENTHLCIALCGENQGFTEIRQIVDYLMKQLGVEITISEEKIYCMVEGRSGNIFLGEKKIGIIGEVSPQTIETFGIEYPIALCELHLELFHTLLQQYYNHI